MKYQGKIQDPKDLVTKEYVDGRSGVTSVNGKSGDVEVSWEDIQNTPTTLSGYGITDAIGSNEKGANNGVATLDNSGKIPTTQIKQQIIISSTAPTASQKFNDMLWYQIL